MNHKCHVKKLDKDSYVNLKTGEIKEFEHIESRKDSLNSLRQTFKKLRYLINNNFSGNDNELHVTLTYAENMRDVKRLYKDFDKFMKKLKYRFKDISSIDYISVVEPQGRGAWHCHLLLRFNDMEKVYIKHKELADMWGLGFIKIRPLANVDNIGAYLSAYLADIPVDPDDIDENGKPKKIIKGGRLKYYPTGMNIYRKSRGIKYPERKKMLYKSVKKIVGDINPHYKKVIEIEKDDFTNIITYEQYNQKRI
jgi:hypothetical protein